MSDFTMLLIFLVSFHLASADVIRDDWYNNYEGQFTVVHKGRMLRVLMYFNTLPLKECALHCVRHLRCKTFNYNHVKRTCELTDEEFDEMNAETISPGWYNHATPPKVDGGWSSWRNLTDCTKKCNNGTLEQWRECDSPKTEHGGVDCKGRMRRKVKCNTHECPVVNVALNKKTKQSSTYSDSSYYSPSKAVDGDISTLSCTEKEPNPWWEVDLGGIRVIKYIHLNLYVGRGYNKGLLVQIRKDEKESWSLCKDLGDLTKRETEFTCNGGLIEAQFLRIQSTEKCFLYIYEVEIFGYGRIV